MQCMRYTVEVLRLRDEKSPWLSLIKGFEFGGAVAEGVQNFV